MKRALREFLSEYRFALWALVGFTASFSATVLADSIRADRTGRTDRMREFVFAGGGTCSNLAPFSWSMPVPTSACVCDGGVPGLLFDGGASYCTKGNEFSGIQAGDMVYCPTDTPRFMPGGDGGGDIGLQVWASRRNGLLYSQQFDNAAWQVSHTSPPGVDVTVTPNACAAPDGTMTADLVFFPAAADSSHLAYMYQTNCAIGYDVRMVYARAALADAGFGDGGITATLNIGGNTETRWTFNSSGYTRLHQADQDAGDIIQYFDLVGRGPISDQYVCLWQADCQENNERATDPWPPPILTTSAAVTRTADVARFDPKLFPMWTNYTQSVRYVPENGYGYNTDETYACLLDVNTGTGVDGNRMYKKSATLWCEADRGGVSNSSYSYPTLSSSADSLQCRYDGDPTTTGSNVLTSCINGTCGDAGFIDAGVIFGNRVNIGSLWNGAVWQDFADGVVKDVNVSEASCKTIFLFGDSIVEGNAAGPGFQPQYVLHRLKGNKIAITNSGVSGYTSLQCVAAMESEVDIIVDAGMQGSTYMMLQCGTNSSPDAGGTISDLEGALLYAKNAGIHVIGSTITPHQSTDSYISAVNTALRAWGPANGVPIAETWTPLTTGDAGALNPIYNYNSDTLHLNDAGTWIETNIWMRTGGW